MRPGPTVHLDHLVVATPDVDATVEAVQARLGVTGTPGGRHVGLGTRNWLLALGPGSYLEVIGPDPDQPDPAGPRPFGIDDLDGPLLATWAVATSALDDAADAVRRAGHDPGAVLDLERDTPSGDRLSWRMTMRAWAGRVEVVPFLIDWGDTPHPSRTAPGGARVVAFRAEHPDPAGVARVLDALGARLDVVAGPAPRLVAELAGPAGSVTVA